MRVHRLEMTAFGPFADHQVVDFGPLNAAGVFLLTGHTGAGKTSILDAVCFGLFGRVPGVRDKARRYRSDHAPATVPPRVVLEVTLQGRRLRLTRSPAWRRPARRGRSSLVEEKAKATAEELVGDRWVVRSSRADEVGHLVAGLLGLDRDQFCQVVMLPQGEFQAFLRSGGRDRQALLARLFRTGRFERVEGWLPTTALPSDAPPRVIARWWPIWSAGSPRRPAARCPRLSTTRLLRRTTAAWPPGVLRCVTTRRRVRRPRSRPVAHRVSPRPRPGTSWRRRGNGPPPGLGSPLPRPPSPGSMTEPTSMLPRPTFSTAAGEPRVDGRWSGWSTPASASVPRPPAVRKAPSLASVRSATGAAAGVDAERRPRRGRLRAGDRDGPLPAEQRLAEVRSARDARAESLGDHAADEALETAEAAALEGLVERLTTDLADADAAVLALPGGHGDPG